MMRPNRATLEFAIRKLRFVATSDACLCALYPHHDLDDPEREQKQGRVVIDTVRDAPYAEITECRCTTCDTAFTIERGEYHYSWWSWRHREETPHSEQQSQT
jgi:hypothetical protein